jgi:uncharacterized protein (TIGR02284 family)
VHKGNIMKFTEGAFRDWGYQVAKDFYGAVEVDGGPWCRIPEGKPGAGLVIKDAIADITLQQVLTRPDEFDVIATLNDLLEISRDGEQGFRTCAEGVENPSLKAIFASAARRCAEGAAELDAKVRSLGGEPAQGGSISGSMHRAWTNIKSAITGMNEHAVLAECERGEDAAKAAYEAALQKSLPADVRTLVERQYQGVKANHDRVRNLRNAAA